LQSAGQKAGKGQVEEWEFIVPQVFKKTISGHRREPFARASALNREDDQARPDARMMEPGRQEPAGLEHQTDEALVERVAVGDMTAFEQIHRRYFPRLMRFALRIADSQEAAEEVANDALMTVWRTADRFEGRSQASTWMFGIAYRMAMKARQKAAKRKDDVELDEGMIGVGADEADKIVLKTDLAGALKRLAPDLRAVVELTYFNGYIYTEIAEILGCPVGTVKTRMMTARRRLRDMLDEDEFFGEQRAFG
jgi:RNA polymerase sigma-70 factor (ECF subfamily)